MKILRRSLAVFLALCLAALFAAVLFRIYIAEHYPKDSVRIVFTEPLTEYYEKTDGFKAYTQDIRIPYDDANDGSFFADGLLFVPDAENLQITVRYNESSLETVAQKYKLAEIPTARDGLFRYTLTVSYNEDVDGTDFRTYGASYSAESDAYMYHYTKLVFDGVDFEGVAWARVDIYLEGEEEAFGAITVYETRFEYGGDTFPYESEEARIPKGDLPK